MTASLINRKAEPMQDTLIFERRSLNAAKWASLFMAGAGVVAGLLANSDALLLDGLFSGLNFATAVVAGWVAASIRRAPDQNRPFGYEIDESVFVMFRSLLLFGIIVMAAGSAVNRLLAYAKTGEAAPVVLEWILIYAGAMAAICLTLFAYHRWNWRRTGKTSDLLRVEARAAMVDGVLSLGAGAAFFAINLLEGGPLAGLVPVSDALVVLLLCLALLPQPIKVFLGALRDIVGVALPADARAEIIEQARRICADSPFQVLDVATVRSGRALFHLVYLKPAEPVTIEAFEAVRDRLARAASPGRVALTLASDPPFGPAPRAQ
ncbi:cation transporter [Ruegeria arenilitoris]|uniref:cation transporter n=1 Tax=Ruegeria arenilitoris TaxID=1173585 RepID=UPI001C960727|nr:cation transporter [Ruegeria arenilitoris]MBY6084364.1 cation transporter [Ruegeria arenilitoris]